MTSPLKPQGPTEPVPAMPPLRRFALAMARALLLHCPECGIHPIFKPLSHTRTLRDWHTPLPGCPGCKYPYERESGYFLMAIWGVQYFIVTGAGLALGLILVSTLQSLTLAIILTIVPTVLFGFAFVRHAKAFYIAIDHYFDPHLKG